MTHSPPQHGKTPEPAYLRSECNAASVTLSLKAFRHFTPLELFYSLILTQTGRASTPTWQATKCVSWQPCAPSSSSPPSSAARSRVSPSATTAYTCAAFWIYTILKFLSSLSSVGKDKEGLYCLLLYIVVVHQVSANLKALTKWPQRIHIVRFHIVIRVKMQQNKLIE